MTGVALYYPPPKESLRSGTSTPNPTPRHQELKDCRLLLAEDDPDVSDVLRRALTRLGYDVDLRANCEALFDGLSARPDVVVLDVGFSSPSGGFEVCRRLRGAGNQVPVLMLMDRATGIDRVVARDSGADECLVKPFRLGDLVRCIPTLLQL